MSKGFGSSNKKKGEPKIRKNAIKAHQEGDLEKAENLYNRYLAKNEKDFVCLNNLGNINKLRGQLEKAEKNYVKAIHSNPKHSLSYINCSNLLIEKNDFKAAIQIIDDGLVYEPNNIDLNLNKAISLNYLLEFDEAISIAQKIYQIDRNNYKILFYLGLVHENAKLTKESERYFDECLIACAKNSDLMNKLSLILRSNSQINGAIKFMKKAIIVSPNIVDYHSNLLGLLRENGDLDEATLKAETLIRDFPDYGPGYINFGGLLKEKGELVKAKEITERAIEIDHNSDVAYLNLGAISKELGDLNKAIIYTRKAIDINPLIENGLSNLASMLIDNEQINEGLEITKNILSKQPENINANLTLANIYQIKGDVNQSESYLINCLNYNLEVYRAHFLLSLSKKYIKKEAFKKFILEKDESTISSPIDRIDFNFTKSNIAHHEKNYDNAIFYLKKANDIKLKIHPSDKDIYLNKSNLMIKESKSYLPQQQQQQQQITKSIFIVGMPRCGSTLIESILSTNREIVALGEVRDLEQLFFEFNKKNVNKKDYSLEKRYREIIKKRLKYESITVDKQLYNYLYAGFISNYMPEAKIIHCIRNPYDNLLSIYKAHFLSGNRYASNLSDCAEVYLKHYETMKFFKSKYKTKIYTVNYDLLVRQPENQIKDLINWLGFEWNENYLSPHLNKREVNTASRVQVRSPINTKSLGNWEKYKNLFNNVNTSLEELAFTY